MGSEISQDSEIKYDQTGLKFPLRVSHIIFHIFPISHFPIAQNTLFFASFFHQKKP